MRFTVAIALLLILGSCISCGGESDSAPSDRPLVPDPNVVRMNGGCTDERFHDAERAAYQALLQARAEAARVLDWAINNIEKIYKAELSKANLNYLAALNKCGNDSACTEKAKSDNDTSVGTTQDNRDDAIYIAQGNELAEKEQAQQNYESAVKEAREEFCRRGYSVTGQAGDSVLSGVVCDLEKPFDVSATHPLANYVFKFVPSKPGAGTASYALSYEMVSESGKGTYTQAAGGDGLDIVFNFNSVARVLGRSVKGSGVANIHLAPLPLESNDCK